MSCSRVIPALGATQELDHFLFQELQQLNLKEGLEEEIERKLGALTHVDFLQSTLAEAIQYFESETVGVIDQLLKLRGMSMELEKRSQTFSPLASRFNALFIEAEDLLRECKDSYENLETDPEALALFQAKYDALNNQMLKHKVNTVNELITVMNQLENRLKQDLQKRSENNALRELKRKSDLSDFSSNDYLGFAKLKLDSNHDIGSGGSRLLSGNSIKHEELEAEIAIFHGHEAALIFNSGYNANVGLLSTIPQRYKFKCFFFIPRRVRSQWLRARISSWEISWPMARLCHCTA